MTTRPSISITVSNCGPLTPGTLFEQEQVQCLGTFAYLTGRHGEGAALGLRKCLPGSEHCDCGFERRDGDWAGRDRTVGRMEVAERGFAERLLQRGSVLLGGLSELRLTAPITKPPLVPRGWAEDVTNSQGASPELRALQYLRPFNMSINR